jgi:hypothetical protein
MIGLLVIVGVGAIAFALTRSSPTPAASAPPPPSAAPKLAVSAPADRTTTAAPKKDDGAVDISALGASSGDQPAATVPGPLRPRNPNDKDGDGKPDKPADSSPPATPDTSVPSAAAAPTPVATGSVGALADEIRKRMGGTDDQGTSPENATAAGNADAKQQHPSAGAVSGAIGAVRGAARACLDGQESITRVSVVFSSDGTVKSISVSGGAGGTPAESCVRSAVQKAKVAPFVEPSYSTSFTIRP